VSSEPGAGQRQALKVELSDIEVAQAIMRRSDDVLSAGMSNADKNRLLDHAEMRREVIRRLKDNREFPNHEASFAELKASFKHNTKKVGALKQVLDDMVDTGILEYIPNRQTGGRGKDVFRLVRE
jgi:hypothetical protein